MKSEAEYKLIVGIESLEKRIGELKEEMNTLDPFAAIRAQFLIAGIEGTLEYMKGGISE